MLSLGAEGPRRRDVVRKEPSMTGFLRDNQYMYVFCIRGCEVLFEIEDQIDFRMYLRSNCSRESMCGVPISYQHKRIDLA